MKLSPTITSKTEEKTSQWTLAENENTSMGKTWIWMGCCTTPSLTNKDKSCKMSRI